MASNNSIDLVYKNFKKLDKYVLICIWSILAFSLGLLISEFILYKYLRRKLLEEELFLYFFIATILFYFTIVLSAFYILSKLNSYKNLGDKTLELKELSESPMLEEDGIQNFALQKSDSQSTLQAPKLPQKESLRNPTPTRLQPDSVPERAAICSLSSSTKTDKEFQERDSNLLNNKEFLIRSLQEECKDRICCQNMKNLREHFRIRNSTAPYYLTMNHFSDAKSRKRQGILLSCPKNRYIFDVPESKQKLQELRKPHGTSKENVRETSLSLDAKNLLNYNYVVNKHFRHKSNKLIPEIIVEDVDAQTPTWLTHPVHQSIENCKPSHVQDKKSLGTHKAVVKCQCTRDTFKESMSNMEDTNFVFCSHLPFKGNHINNKEKNDFQSEITTGSVDAQYPTRLNFPAHQSIVRCKLQEIPEKKKPNLIETNFILGSEIPTNQHDNNTTKDSCRTQQRKMLIPKIVIEDVDAQTSTEILPSNQSIENGKLDDVLTKNNSMPQTNIKSVKCYDCPTCKRVKMAYNTVGLPELDVTKNNENYLNSNHFTRNKFTGSLRNQKVIYRV